MSDKYDLALLMPVGSPIRCPTCDTTVYKRSQNQVFCSDRGAGNCKTLYQQKQDPARASRMSARFGG